MFTFSSPAPAQPLHWGWRAALAGLATAGLWLGGSLSTLAQPTITNVSPARNQVAAPRTASFTATFSEAMNVGSAGLALKVFGSQAGGKKAGAATGTGNTLTFNPSTDFKAGELVQATVQTDALSAGGQQLAQGQVVQFRAAAGAGPGTFTTFPGPTVPTGTSTQDVVSADVDDDGDLDMLVANSATPTLDINLNDGTGSFSPGTTVTLAGVANDMAVGDVDADGDLDILTTSFLQSLVTVCLNNGNGTFSIGQPAIVGAGMTALALGDLDADGDLDLALANLAGQNVTLYRNDGSGVFSFRLTGSLVASGPNPAVQPSDIAISDLNDDGHLDVAIAMGNPGIGILLNNGLAGISNLSTWGYDIPGAVQALAVGDVTGDRQPEIVVGNDRSKVYVVQLPSPTTSISVDTLNLGFGLPNGFWVKTYPSLADLDGDGDLDILTATNNDFPLTGHRNNGAGSFAFWNGTSNLLAYVGNKPHHLTIGDWDGDHDLDIAVAGFGGSSAFNSDKVSVLFNATPLMVTNLTPKANRRNAARAASFTATFNQPMRAATAATGLRLFGSQTGRKAGAGSGTGNSLTFDPTTGFKPGELIHASITSAALSAAGQALGFSYYDRNTGYAAQFTAAAGVGPGLFTQPVPATAPSAPSPKVVASGDVDGDGRPDLLVANVNTPTISVNRNLGNGSFALLTTITLSDFVSDMALGDLDNDGDLDLMTSSPQISVLSSGGRVCINDGTGTFALGGGAGNRRTALSLGDLDGDGDLDVAFADSSGQSVYIAYNFTGAADYLQSTTISLQRTASSRSSDVAIGDLNNDGYMDLALALAGSHDLAVVYGGKEGRNLLNAPSIRYYSTLAGGGFTNPNSIALADFDGDDTLDVAMAGDAGKVVVMHQGGGPRHEVLVQFGASARNITAADIDGDGDFDLLATDNSGTVVTRLNDGAGVFTAPMIRPTTAIGTNASSLTVADFDGDNDLDFATADRGSRTVSVRLNMPEENLIVDHVQTVPASNYRNVLVTSTGEGTLAGDIQVSGSLMVQDGGQLTDGCHRITGAGAFTLEAGASLFICDAAGISATGATGTVQVAGRRTFSTDATYVYNGTQAQITGTGLPARVRLLGSNNSQPLALTNAVGIRRGVALLNSGNIVSDGKLTLLSDAAYTALVGNFGTGVITGEAIAQRYLDPSANPGLGFRHFSSPTTNSPISDLSASGFTALVNPLYNTNPTAVPANVFPNVFGFDESRLPASMTFTDGYFSPAALTDQLVPGHGYTAYMRGTVKPDFRGTFNNGPVPVTLTKTGFGTVGTKPGWNFLGNPYPSPLNWDAIPANAFPVNMSHAVSVYKSTGAGQSGMYLSRINGIGSLPDGQIAMAQGFFVELTSGTTASFSFENAYRELSVVNPSHFRTAAPETRPIIGLTLQSTTAGALADEALVYFQNGATAAVDPAFDAARPAHNTGAAPTLASLTATGDELAINGLPETALATGQRIGLRLDVPTAGTYTLNLSRFENLAGADLHLYDALTNTTQPLTAGAGYLFTATTAGLIDGRFWLNVNTQRVTGDNSSSLIPHSSFTIFPNPAHGQVQLVAPGATTATLLDGLGRAVRTIHLEAGAATLDLSDLVPGVYVVRAGTRNQRLVVE